MGNLTPKPAASKLTGPMGRERLTVKTFEDKRAMHAFLNKDANATQWQERTAYPTTAGTYAFVGGKWHNVKSLPASVLAHA